MKEKFIYYKLKYQKIIDGILILSLHLKNGTIMHMVLSLKVARITAWVYQFRYH